MLNIAVLVSGGGTNLQAMLDAKARGEIPNGRFACVVASNPKAYALERAKNAGVETEVLVRKEFSTQDAYDDALLGLLERHNIDLVVLAGFMTILSERVAKAYAYRMINVHPALIPSFCGQGYYGLRVHEAALEYGVKGQRFISSTRWPTEVRSFCRKPWRCKTATRLRSCKSG